MYSLAVVGHCGVGFRGVLGTARLAEDQRKYRVLRAVVAAHELHLDGDVSRRALAIREVQIAWVDIQQVPAKNNKQRAGSGVTCTSPFCRSTAYDALKEKLDAAAV